MKALGFMLPAGLAISLLTGCAAKTTLTVHSEPMGAYITEVGTGRALGMAPLTLIYDGETLWKSRDAAGCFSVAGLEARWVSGATAAMSTIKGCNGIVENYSIKLSRDPNAPGLDKDLEFALKAQAVQAHQRQAQSAGDAAVISAWSAGK